MRRSLRVVLLVATAVLILPTVADAHLSSTGLGPFYDGVSHFFISPEEFIPALALALLAGLRGSKTGRFALFILPGAWFLGGLLGLAGPSVGHSTALTCISFLVLGALVAIDAPFRPSLVAGLAMAFGFAHGYLDGVGMSESKMGVLGLIGSVASLFVLVALAAALVTTLHAPWARIVVRVAGSWIAAAGLLLLGWALHSNTPNPRSPSSKVQQELPAPLSTNEVQVAERLARNVVFQGFAVENLHRNELLAILLADVGNSTNV